MKIGGIQITGDLAEPNEEVLVLPRRNGQIVFTARAIADMEDFEKRVVPPKPKKNFHKGKGWVEDLGDKTYMKSMDDYAKLRVGYFVVASLQEVEWSVVDIDNPSTWLKWEDELKSVGFSQHECNLVLQLCFQVNQLDETKLEQARALFVLGREEAVEMSSSLDSEQANIPSGVPAKESE